MSQARFVHIIDAAEPLPPPDGSPTILLVSLQGFLDAGNAASIAAGHLLGSAEGSHEAPEHGTVVASFDVDEFYDYRARRPPLTFAQDHYEGYEAPRLALREMHDRDDRRYLLLTGPEPDVRWEAFAADVRALVEHFDVDLTVFLGSVPMAVPHTRPVQLTNHATRSSLMVQDNIWSGDIRVPASAQSLLELRLGEWGHDATGFVAHIPHYVAQFDYPQAALALLQGVTEVSGLTWEDEELKEAGEARQVELATQIADSDDVREVVQGLEQQYDAFHSQAANLLAEDEPLPSGEELGAQFEQFLARLEDPEGE